MPDVIGRFERDGSLREVRIEVLGGSNWAVLVECAIRGSAHHVFSLNGDTFPGTPSFAQWFPDAGDMVILGWSVGGVWFQTYFNDPIHPDFDFMPTDEPGQEASVRRFLTDVAARFGARLRVEHEHGDFEPSYIDPPTPGR